MVSKNPVMKSARREKYQGTQCSMAELEHKMGSWTEQLMTTMSLNPSLKEMEEIYQGRWKWLTL